MSKEIECENKPKVSVGRSLLEWGFLWAIFFAPWGPVPRYFGWLLALVGLIVLKVRGENLNRLSLAPLDGAILAFFLVWSFVTTVAFQRDPYMFGKGFSLPLEFAFGVWLAFFLLQEPKILRRFRTTLWATAIVTFAWTILCFALTGNMEGPFSHHNTMGAHALFLLSPTLAYFLDERLSPREATLAFFALLGSCVMLFLSFSSGAWAGGAVVLLFSLLFLRRDVRLCWRRVCLLLLCGVSLVGISILVDKTLVQLLFRELSQLASAGDIEAFSNNRSLLWQAAWNMTQDSPILGHGWKSFKELFPAFAPEGWKWGAPSAPHNGYLTLLVSGGFPLLLSYLALQLRMIKSAYRAFKGGIHRHHAVAALSLVVGQLVYSMGGSHFDARQTVGCIAWALMGLALALGRK
ncbi:MAG TPA: O-antigen ligase family protein [Thermosynergistes sp.]|nr:O-antigen ligase family protein [Thermosynergistes sp.]